jgi:hypothetical protein
MADTSPMRPGRGAAADTPQLYRALAISEVPPPTNRGSHRCRRRSQRRINARDIGIFNAVQQTWT